MKKIININLSGRVIPIEDSAYESLQRYIESLRRYFAHEEGRDEIINDIESRVAELMNDKVRKGAHAITDTDIEEIISSMGRIEDFEEVDAAENKTSAGQASKTATYTHTQSKSAKSRLYRDTSDKLLGGVCSGIANYMNVDPAVVRLLFAIITFGGFGFGILIYILLWIILPSRDLDAYVGKRLFRNPDDRVISGVAGGLGAYFNKPAWLIRLIFAAPLLLNITFGVINSIFFLSHRDIFPNLFIGSFTGTFCLAYIILWIVLPEARSPFEKMEMRGEKVDVNRIRQNVKEGMSDFKNRMGTWGEEVKTSAQELGTKASDFANTRGKAFAGEVAETARPLARGIGHIIGVLFKAFFIFVAGCITLGLFAALMVIIFGGVAWWPINNFLWTSSLQKALAWGTLLFFIGVPIIAFMTWLIRRMVRVRSRNRYLGYIFGGLWTIGWVCAISFAASIAKDLRMYERVSTDVALAQPAAQKMIIKVNEPEIRYSGNFAWLQSDNTGWDVSDNQIKYNNVKIRVEKSEDSLYHVTVFKYSAGQSVADAQQRAGRTGFTISSVDSVLNIGSGITIDRRSKFRGQGVILELQVPVGKMIRFDESIIDAYNPWVIRRRERDDYRWGRRNRYQYDWEYNDYFDWNANKDYVMTSDGKLKAPADVINNEEGTFERKSSADSIRNEIKAREEQNRKDQERIREIERTKRQNGSTTLKRKDNKESNTLFIVSPFVPLII